MGISASDAKPRAQQAAFKRASECLLGTNEVAIWDGYVWMTDRGA
jgi:hypothetical protein